MTVAGRDKREGIETPAAVRTIVMIASEHNRPAGLFDYNYPQFFYSLYPDIEQETYISVGGTSKRRVHDDDE